MIDEKSLITSAEYVVEETSAGEDKLTLNWFSRLMLAPGETRRGESTLDVKKFRWDPFSLLDFRNFEVAISDNSRAVYGCEHYNFYEPTRLPFTIELKTAGGTYLETIQGLPSSYTHICGGWYNFSTLGKYDEKLYELVEKATIHFHPTRFNYCR